MVEVGLHTCHFGQELVQQAAPLFALPPCPVGVASGSGAFATCVAFLRYVHISSTNEVRAAHAASE